MASKPPKLFPFRVYGLGFRVGRVLCAVGSHDAFGSFRLCVLSLCCYCTGFQEGLGWVGWGVWLIKWNGSIQFPDHKKYRFS